MFSVRFAAVRRAFLSSPAQPLDDSEAFLRVYEGLTVACEQPEKQAESSRAVTVVQKLYCGVNIRCGDCLVWFSKRVESVMSHLLTDLNCWKKKKNNTCPVTQFPECLTQIGMISEG